MKISGHGIRWLSFAALVSAAFLAPLTTTQEAAAATVLRVPQDHPTIQAAIDAAAPGDSVLVSPGTYVERIDFRAKEITVESTDGPATTIIDGSRSGSVVRINAGDGQTPVLRGFTIRNGDDISGGGGVWTTGGPALIEGNRVTGNFSCNGAGIDAEFSAATIRVNIVTDNQPGGCTGGSGGGILVSGGGTAHVLNNVISGNTASASGGGITLFASGEPTISGNVISNNVSGISSSDGGSGGGIWIVNASNALITNNVITGNRAFFGGGIYWLVPFGDQGPNVVNNTIADNTSGHGSALFADGFDAATRLTNNVLVASGAPALECGNFNDLNPPVITRNDVFNTDSGPAYGGICTDQTGQNGNISANPLFVDAAAGNYHVRAGSPVIDAGTNEGAPATDFDGNARPLDGNGDGQAVVDMGAYEVPRIADGTPPVIRCAATPSTLRPPNHKLVPVTVGVSASDDSGSVTVTLSSVTSSQRDSGLGRDDVPNDIQGWTTGTDDRKGLLRAERFGKDRVYTFSYQAKDPAGNAASCKPKVTVP